MPKAIHKPQTASGAHNDEKQERQNTTRRNTTHSRDKSEGKTVPSTSDPQSQDENSSKFRISPFRRRPRLRRSTHSQAPANGPCPHFPAKLYLDGKAIRSCNFISIILARTLILTTRAGQHATILRLPCDCHATKKRQPSSLPSACLRQ